MRDTTWYTVGVDEGIRGRHPTYRLAAQEARSCFITCRRHNRGQGMYEFKPAEGGHSIYVGQRAALMAHGFDHHFTEEAEHGCD